VTSDKNIAFYAKMPNKKNIFLLVPTHLDPNILGPTQNLKFCSLDFSTMALTTRYVCLTPVGQKLRRR